MLGRRLRTARAALCTSPSSTTRHATCSPSLKLVTCRLTVRLPSCVPPHRLGQAPVRAHVKPLFAVCCSLSVVLFVLQADFATKTPPASLPPAVPPAVKVS